MVLLQREENMNRELAKNAMQFMMRVDLKGAEVPAFNAVMAELDAMSNPDSTQFAYDKAECEKLPT